MKRSNLVNSTAHFFEDVERERGEMQAGYHGELILLGTGTSHGVPIIGCHCHVCQSTNPRNHRMRTGVAVQAPGGMFLIDTPPELRLQLIREKIDLIHAVIYTHSHADHLFGLDDLRLFGYRLHHPVPLYCEEIVERQIRSAYSYAFAEPDPDLHHGALPQLELRRMGLEPFELLGLTVLPIRLLHGKLPVLGFRIGNVAFCTDVSCIPEESWPRLANLDVLIIDALREEGHATHFGIREAMQVIDRTQPRRAFLTHVSHHLDYDTTNAKLPPNVELAYDGLRIPFHL
jgi:phosphoribosyl 1,2-cyclic phosphate phosphodiesterase